jgi:hypothetical protein
VRGSPRSSAPSRGRRRSGRRRSRSPTACASRAGTRPRPTGGRTAGGIRRGRVGAHPRAAARGRAQRRPCARARRHGAGRGGARRLGRDQELPLGLAAFLAGAERVAEGGPVARALLVKLLSASFEPTLVYDRAATEARRASAAASVDATRYRVARGERVVGAHEVVGREEFDKLRALRDAADARGVGDGRSGARVARAAGATLANLLVVAVLVVFLWLFRPEVYRSMRAVGTFAGAFALVLGAAALAARIAPDRPEYVPVALAAVILSILFDARVALVAALVLAVLVAAQGPFRGTNALLVFLVGGAAAAVSVRTLSRRTQLYKSALAVAAGYALAALALGLALGWGWRAVAASALAGVASAAGSVALAMALLPWPRRPPASTRTSSSWSGRT